jgi:hypothetical protein
VYRLREREKGRDTDRRESGRVGGVGEIMCVCVCGCVCVCVAHCSESKGERGDGEERPLRWSKSWAGSKERGGGRQTFVS